MPTLKDSFPDLNANNYIQTSSETSEYNCIAWAAEENDRFWWPVPNEQAYWPAGVRRSVLLESFVEAFQNLDYEICQSGELETDYQKVVIYVDSNGLPTHMARQLENGSWTSKLGQYIDIEHSCPEALHGPEYGTVSTYMRRIKNALP